MNFPHVSSRLVRHARLSRARWPLLVLAGLLAASAGSSTWAQSSGSGSAGSMGSGSGSSPSSQGAPVAQPGTGTRNTPEKPRLVRADRKFIEEAAASGQMEVQAAQLASTRASDKAVKDFAATLADHHASANSELMQLAASLGIELPPGPPRAMRNELEKLAKRTGTEFDREYVKEIGVKEHERDIKRFQKASKEVKDPQLKAWIDKTLPGLQAHLAAAQKLPQAGSEAAASTKAQQQRMGAGTEPSGSGRTGAGGSSGTSSGSGGAGSGSSGGNTTAPYGR